MWINHNVEYTRLAAQGVCSIGQCPALPAGHPKEDPALVRKSKDDAAPLCLKALSSFGIAVADILFSDDFPVEQVIFCPTHKYKRKPLEKSTPIPYPDRRN